jgi:hypothetical protein
MKGLMLLMRTAKCARYWCRSSVDVHRTIELLLLLGILVLLLQGRVLLSVLIRQLLLLLLLVCVVG